MTAPYLNQEKILAHNFCAGEWVPPTGEEILVSSPYTGQEIGRTHHSTPKDIDAVLEAAQKGFNSWQGHTMKERAQVLFNFRQQLLDHLGEMSQMVALENGKTVEEAKAGILKELKF